MRCGAWPLLPADRAVAHLPSCIWQSHARVWPRSGPRGALPQAAAPSALWRLYDPQGRFFGLGDQSIRGPAAGAAAVQRAARLCNSTVPLEARGSAVRMRGLQNDNRYSRSDKLRGFARNGVVHGTEKHGARAVSPRLRKIPGRPKFRSRCSPSASMVWASISLPTSAITPHAAVWSSWSISAANCWTT